jgi:hypothetical protein
MARGCVDGCRCRFGGLGLAKGCCGSDVDLIRRRNLKPSLRQRVEAEAVALG